MSDVNVIFNSEEPKVLDLEFKGYKFQLKVRELSWSEKNRILSQCFTYQTDGSISFNFDKYNKEMLKKIIVSCPPEWGGINEIFFSRISPSFGAFLEKLVPRAFEDIKTNDFFAKE